MPIERLIFFAVWLAFALAGGGLIVFAWERWHARQAARDGVNAAPPNQGRQA